MMYFFFISRQDEQHYSNDFMGKPDSVLNPYVVFVFFFI